MILCLSWINDFQPEYMGKTLIIACLASVAFLTLEYCVNFFLDIIGDFILLVFMVLQLSGCAGTYPLELSDKFYQVLNPFMPFTYTVHGFRSGIASGLDITTEELDAQAEQFALQKSGRSARAAKQLIDQLLTQYS